MRSKKKKKRLLTNLHVDTIGYGGVGIATAENGKKVVIRGGVLPNSVVHCRIRRKKKDYWDAVVTKVISYDAYRMDAQARCPHFKNPTKDIPEGEEHRVGCGGCKRQATSYSKQLELKQDLIEDSFRSFQDIRDHAQRLPLLPSPKQFQYRNKMEFSFGKYISGKAVNEQGEYQGPLINHQWNLGFHKQGEFSKVLQVDQCFLASQGMHEVFSRCKLLCKQSGLPVYDQKIHTGVLRHLVIREGVRTQQILVNLVIADQKLISPEMNQQREKLQETLSKDKRMREHVHTFLVTYNNGLADIVKGKDIHSRILWGNGYIHEQLQLNNHTHDEEEIHENNAAYIIEEGVAKQINKPNTQIQPKDTTTLDPVSFRVSPFSFFQTNTWGAEVLFNTAAQRIGATQGTILDLYCGTGTIGLSFLRMKKGDFVVGIESVPEAIDDAYVNARINQMEDACYFVAGKAEDILRQDKTVRSKLEDIGLIIVDPPRSGLHKHVIQFLIDMKREHQCKLLYISCNPVTLARDLQLLEQGGRKTGTIQGVDMFPHTHHVELISTLR